MSGATTALPGKLDPSTGFDLNYFTNADGFAKAMCPLPGEGVVWLSGLVVLPDGDGQQRMLAWFQRRRGLEAVLDNGFVIYNDAKDLFEKKSSEPVDALLFPIGYPSRIKTKEGADYIYFTDPYPSLRVKADFQSYLDLSQYEGYTCLKEGTRFAGVRETQLDRDNSGK